MQTYRKTDNQYAGKVEEARAMLDSERADAMTLEAKRAALLAEVNAGLAPFEVYRHKGGTFEYDTVRLTHPDSGIACYLCDEATMLDELPQRVGTAPFAKKVEAIEADILRRRRRKTMVRRVLKVTAYSALAVSLACSTCAALG